MVLLFKNSFFPLKAKEQLFILLGQLEEEILDAQRSALHFKAQVISKAPSSSDPAAVGSAVSKRLHEDFMDQISKDEALDLQNLQLRSLALAFSSDFLPTFSK